MSTKHYTCIPNSHSPLILLTSDPLALPFISRGLVYSVSMIKVLMLSALGSI